jgi:Transcriptional regulatory protein, C terminal
MDFDPQTNLVDVYVGYLRRKLGESIIETVRGAGTASKPRLSQHHGRLSIIPTARWMARPDDTCCLISPAACAAGLCSAARGSRVCSMGTAWSTPREALPGAERPIGTGC